MAKKKKGKAMCGTAAGSDNMAKKKKKKGKWQHVGGDLEARFDGFKYVDFRIVGTTKKLMFASRGALEAAVALIPEEAPG